MHSSGEDYITIPAPTTSVSLDADGPPGRNAAEPQADRVRAASTRRPLRRMLRRRMDVGRNGIGAGSELGPNPPTGAPIAPPIRTRCFGSGPRPPMRTLLRAGFCPARSVCALRASLASEQSASDAPKPTQPDSQRVIVSRRPRYVPPKTSSSPCQVFHRGGGPATSGSVASSTGTGYGDDYT